MPTWDSLLRRLARKTSHIPSRIDQAPVVLGRFVRALVSDPIETLRYVPDAVSHQLFDGQVAHDVEEEWGPALHRMVGTPEKVLETGVARGVTSRVILEAMSINGTGHLWSIDPSSSIPPRSSQGNGGSSPDSLPRSMDLRPRFEPPSAHRSRLQPEQDRPVCS